MAIFAISFSKLHVAEHTFCMAAEMILQHRCFAVNFPTMFRTDVLKNTSSGVLVDIKSLTLCVRLKTCSVFYF